MPIHPADAVPEKAQKAVDRIFSPLANEHLVLVYDRTVFGSAKKGMLVTDQRIIVYDDEEQRSVRYAQLTYAYWIALDAPHYKLVLTHDDGTSELNIYTNDAAHLDRIVELIRAQAAPDAWRDAEAAASDAREERIAEAAAVASDGRPIRVNSAPHIDPLCPHCEAPLQSVNERTLDGLLGVRYVYFCPSCRKVLGMSHRQGYLLS
ncbi:MAG: hypothetical protein KC503_00665 [Myxococcales bacterium]|nr:hypothetical protein [Myxococcales bacterium]